MFLGKNMFDLKYLLNLTEIPEMQFLAKYPLVLEKMSQLTLHSNYLCMTMLKCKPSKVGNQ